MRNISHIIFAMLLLACTSAGCYSFKGGSAPAHIGTVTIPPAEDVSGFFQATLREDLRNELVRKFRDDNSLRIVDNAGADSRLEVTITSIRNQERRNISGAELESVRGVVVETRATFFDNIKRRAVFKDRTFRGESQYDITSGREGENRAFREALDKVTTDILMEVVAAW